MATANGSVGSPSHPCSRLAIKAHRPSPPSLPSSQRRFRVGGGYFPGAGHISHTTHPDGYVEAIIAFTRKHPT
jgi:pimeloyl-ACP methyl ester carboxylesterase